MNRRRVVSISGQLVIVVAVFLLAPCILAIVDRDGAAVAAYGASAALAGVAGWLMHFLAGRRLEGEVHRKDAFGVVALTWVALGLLGGLPFVLEGSLVDPASAFFEGVSGFTTTGATVVADVDGLSRATNLWRCLMHWLGGMGIVVLFVAVFPQLGVGAKQLFRTEVPGPSSEGLKPRIKQTAVTLWLIYLLLTGVCAGLLIWLGMPVYDAVVHALSTLGTGGFSNRTASIGFYENPAIEWTIAVFMLLAGLNFSLYYGMARGHWRELWQNAELRFYLLLNLVVVAIVAVCILPRHDAVGEAVRNATFQVLAVTTTTGFMTEDFDAYPELARFTLFVCMFIGGCAGSTAGGLKAARVLILVKLFARELRTSVLPQAVYPLRMGRRAVPAEIGSGVLVFAATFLFLFVFFSGAVIALGMDVLSGMSATIACLASVGPGLGSVGPAQNYAAVPALSKVLLAACMIAGRLEIFALFAVFTPECWRR